MVTLLSRALKNVTMAMTIQVMVVMAARLRMAGTALTTTAHPYVTMTSRCPLRMKYADALLLPTLMHLRHYLC